MIFKLSLDRVYEKYKGAIVRRGRTARRGDRAKG